MMQKEASIDTPSTPTSDMGCGISSAAPRDRQKKKDRKNDKKGRKSNHSTDPWANNNCDTSIGDVQMKVNNNEETVGIKTEASNDSNYLFGGLPPPSTDGKNGKKHREHSEEHALENTDQGLQIRETESQTHVTRINIKEQNSDHSETREPHPPMETLGDEQRAEEMADRCDDGEIGAASSHNVDEGDGKSTEAKSNKQKPPKSRLSTITDYSSSNQKKHKSSTSLGKTDERQSKDAHMNSRKKTPKRGFRSPAWANRDTQDYLNGYPGKRDTGGCENLRFYKMKRVSEPNGDYIDIIHKKWYGDYKRLERHHGYIQWLFPIREQGLNWHAQELQLKEAKEFRRNKELQGMVIISYEMMLDFYGMKLDRKSTRIGTVKRAKHWEARFEHLNRSMHNYLRITRILKCLGEVGLEAYQAPFVEFILQQITRHGELDNVADSCSNYWLAVVKDSDEKERLVHEYLDSD